MNIQLLRSKETTQALKGKKYKYTYSSGMKAQLQFLEKELTWEILEGENKGEKGTPDYLAREIAEGIYLVQWYEEAIGATITLVINEIAGSVSSSEAYEDTRVFDTAVISEMF